MPFHKKVFKKAKKLVKKVNPFRKIRQALKPKKKTAVRGATKAPTTARRSTTRRPLRAAKGLASGVRVRTKAGLAPTQTRPAGRRKRQRLSAQPFGGSLKKTRKSRIGPKLRRRFRR